MEVRSECNTCRVLGKRGRGKGERKTFNLYPLTFSSNPIPISKCKKRAVLGQSVLLPFEKHYILVLCQASFEGL